MAEQVRYTHSRDGTRIAYAVSGSGPAVLAVPKPELSNVLFRHGTGGFNCVSGIMAAGRTKVAIDPRGCGYSERDCHDYGLDTMVEDIIAVADELGLASFDMYTGDPWTQVAIRLAVSHRDRVRRLALIGAQMPRHEQLHPFRSLLESDFDAYLGATARLFFDVRDETVPEAVAFMRSCVTQADLLRQQDALLTYNVTADFARVSCPVLVATVTTKLMDATAGAAEVAARIPGASLLVFEPVEGELRYERVAHAVARFFAEGLEGGESSPVLSPRELEVLRLLATGNSNQAIADELVLSVRTIHRHVSDIYTKLDLHNRAEATAWAIRNRVV